MSRELLLSCLAAIAVSWVATVAADPQTNLLNMGCSQYNATDHRTFFSNLNATFADLRSQLAASPSARFATAQLTRSADPVYALFQCRPYLSTADCSACLATAQSRIGLCSAANGARVIYDGCFLHYKSATFFDQTTLPGNTAICSNRMDFAAGFGADVGVLMGVLATATARIAGYFAAAERGGAYGVAQCVETVSESGCEQCLSVAYGNIQGCPPNVEGRALDVGCFMRYSDTAFFPANQTVDLAPVPVIRFDSFKTFT